MDSVLINDDFSVPLPPPIPQPPTPTPTPFKLFGFSGTSFQDQYQAEVVLKEGYWVVLCQSFIYMESEGKCFILSSLQRGEVSHQGVFHQGGLSSG